MRLIQEELMETSSFPDRRLLLGLLGLSTVTGVVDAASYLGLGNVFTANMTGNVVFLAFALAGAPGLSAPRCAIALVGFLTGALVGGRVAAAMRSGTRYRGAATGFAAEAALLLTAAAVAIGYPASHAGHSTQLYTVIGVTAVAMGIRNATVRSLGVPDMTTTVLTLTLTGLAADSTLAGGGNPRWPRRVASVVAMAGGAAGGVLLLRQSLALPLAVCACLTGTCALTVRLLQRVGLATRA